MKHWKSIFRTALLTIGVAFCLNFAVVPTAEALLIGTQQEIELGKGVARDLEKKYGLVNDPELQARVAKIGARIVAVSDRKDLPYTFKVLNSKEVNALAVPGGYIYLFKGLVDYMPSDQELAGIIGHEVGHVVKRHTVVQIERSLAVGVLFAILFGNNSSAILGDLIASALMSGYSRGAEREADQQGVMLTMRAGYNPYSLLIAMEKLEAISNKANYGLFSTHPDTESRVKAVRDQIHNDFRVTPRVNHTDKYAQVVEGNWSLPAYHVKYANYTPRMRAHFTAGKIYRLTRLPDYSSDKLYVNDIQNGMAVYYDEDREPVAVVTPQDASANGIASMNEMAQLMVMRIREKAGK